MQVKSFSSGLLHFFHSTFRLSCAAKWLQSKTGDIEFDLGGEIHYILTNQLYWSSHNNVQ